MTQYKLYIYAYIIISVCTTTVSCFKTHSCTLGQQKYYQSSNKLSRVYSNVIDNSDRKKSNTMGDLYDLWVVGAGTLGSSIISEWKRLRPNDKVVAETKTKTRHDYLSSINAMPRLRKDRTTKESSKAKTVIVSIPPSATFSTKSEYNYDLYLAELEKASKLWAGAQHGGSLLFTSSIGIYGDVQGEVNEKLQIEDSSEKTMNLLFSENLIISAGGAVIRLAGLYNTNRGPHTYWLSRESIPSSGDGMINLIHYEDAAVATVLAAIYNCGKSPTLDDHEDTNSLQKIFLASDDNPISRRNICVSALNSGLFSGKKIPEFTGPSEPKGKVCNSTLTRRLLNWAPKYASFADFMKYNSIRNKINSETEF